MPPAPIQTRELTVRENRRVRIVWYADGDVGCFDAEGGQLLVGWPETRALAGLMSATDDWLTPALQRLFPGQRTPRASATAAAAAGPATPSTPPPAPSEPPREVVKRPRQPPVVLKWKI
jgi:hypothetical protein